MTDSTSSKLGAHRLHIMSQFNLVKGEHDTIKAFEAGKGSDDINTKSPDREIILNTFTVTFATEQFDRTIVMDVFEDGTFRIGSSACAQSRDSVVAYGRAAAFLKAADLKDARNRA